MHLAVCRLTLHIYASQSLKDKRRVVQSVSEKLRHRYGVSVAEVGGLDTWQTAVLGVAAVSGEATKAREIIDRAVAYMQEIAPEAEVTSAEVDEFNY